jgi:hypothetical protein
MMRAEDRFAIWSLLLFPLNRSVCVGHAPRQEYINFGHGTRATIPCERQRWGLKRQGFPLTLNETSTIQSRSVLINADVAGNAAGFTLNRQGTRRFIRIDDTRWGGRRRSGGGTSQRRRQSRSHSPSRELGGRDSRPQQSRPAQILPPQGRSSISIWQSRTQQIRQTNIDNACRYPARARMNTSVSG